MKYNELFKMVEHGSYTTLKNGLDYKIVLDNDEKIIYLTFQGTQGFLDAIYDIIFVSVKLYKKQDNNFKIHFGFKSAWKSDGNNDTIESELIEAKNLYSDYKVWICGHSYGGAMALLAAEDYFYRTGEKADKLVTWGCPKILANAESQRYFSGCVGSIVQFENINDPIPKVVPFYRQISETVKFHKDQKKHNFIYMLVHINTYHCAEYRDETYYTGLI